MIFWPSSSSSLWLLAALLLAGCASRTARPLPAELPLIAVLPPTNLAGRSLPLPEVQAQIERELAGLGVPILGRELLEEFLERHRVRYTGGITRAVARAAAEELGVGALLITSVDGWAQDTPPTFAASMRLVAATSAAELLWMEAAARHGGQQPGLFELGVRNDIREVAEQVLRHLSGALALHLQGTAPATGCAVEDRYAPEALFVSPGFGAQQPYSVAVMPFVNDTRRRGAGDLLAAEFVRQLAGQPGQYVVLEPGDVREELLQYRIAVEGGISLDTARVVLELADADLVVTGTVRAYEERSGTPVVEFTAYALTRQDNAIAWQISSWGDGDERVLLFDVGRVATTRDLACRMVKTALHRVQQTAARNSN
jgi:hypothetical protein